MGELESTRTQHASPLDNPREHRGAEDRTAWGSSQRGRGNARTLLISPGSLQTLALKQLQVGGCFVEVAVLVI